MSGFTRVRWNSDFFFANVDHLIIQRNFNPEIGFIPRPNIEKTNFEFTIKPRPRSDVIKQLVIRAIEDYIVNSESGLVETKRSVVSFRMGFESNDCIVVNLQKTFERLFEEFRIRPEIGIPPDDYRVRRLLIQYYGAPGRPFSGPKRPTLCTGQPLFRFDRRWGFFDGDSTEFRANPSIKLSDKLSIDTGLCFPIFFDATG